MPTKIGFDLTFISDVNKVSGEEIVALYILKGLCESELKKKLVIFVDRKVEKQLRRLYKNLKIVVTRKKGVVFYKKFLSRYVRKNKLSTMFYPHASYKMKSKIECKKIVVLHGLHSKDISRRKIRKTIKFLKSCENIVAVSEFVKNELLSKNKRFNKENITVILNPLSDLRAGVDIVYKKKYILCVGDNDSNKNLLSILKAFNEISGEIDHDLVIIGKLSEKEKAYKYIKKYGLAHRVIITGHMNRDTLFGYYKNADLFVNASIYDGFGLTPIEALATGIKVVTTITPSIEAIKDIECEGYINKPKDYIDISEIILMALQTPKDEQHLQKRANKVKEYYNYKKVISKYEQLIKKNLGE